MRTLVSGLFLVLLPSPLPADTVLTGRVLGKGSQPLEVVHIAVLEDGHLLAKRNLRLGPNGEVSVALRSVRSDQLECQISAPGCELTTAVAVVQEGQARLGTIHLQPTLEVGPVSVLESASGQEEDIDFWVTNRVPRVVLVRKLVLSAGWVRRRCALYAPTVTFKFSNLAKTNAGPTDGEEQLQAVVSVQPESAKNSVGAFRVKGILVVNPCAENFIRLEAPYSFAIEASEINHPLKLRLEVPTIFHHGRRTETKVELVWKEAVVGVVLENGDTVTSGRLIHR